MKSDTGFKIGGAFSKPMAFKQSNFDKIKHLFADSDDSQPHISNLVDDGESQPQQEQSPEKPNQIEKGLNALDRCLDQMAQTTRKSATFKPPQQKQTFQFSTLDLTKKRQFTPSVNKTPAS